MKKNEWITLGIAIAALIALLWIGGYFISSLTTSTNQTQSMNTNQTSSIPAVSGKNISNDSKLQIIDVQVGTGTLAKAGSHIYVNYKGMLQDGTVFDSSYNRGEPIDFVLGAGKVIKGWDLGLVGMKVGGKRRLVISPDYAYGAAGYAGVIPPNATLTFDVELVDVK